MDHTIADLERRTERYLPKVLFDWLAGGAEDEQGLRESTAVFARHRLVPRYGTPVGTPDLTRELFGRRWGRPFGVAPTGYTGLLRPGAESMLRGAAERADIPFILSGVSVPALESIAAEEPGRSWYQVYPARDHAITLDIVRRAVDAGYSTLVVTMDMPKEAKRERDWRNGFSLPLRLTPQRVLDGLRHPAWTLRYLRDGGLPPIGTWQKYLPTGASATEVLSFHSQQGYPAVSWAHVADFRTLWPGTLVVKGLLHPDDVTTAVQMGADGVILSNHGGRQLARAPTSLEMLPRVRAAVGPSVPLMLDGGIRRGSDIAMALALGADFVFCGRALLYGVVADGRRGADRAIDILTDELARVMAQTGTPTTRDFGPASLLPPL
jgi:L-lactate dehydrogenase (cytochrome)/(S)-mandelate dehydrogenase